MGRALWSMPKVLRDLKTSPKSLILKVLFWSEEVSWSSKEWWQSVSVTSQALPRTQTVLIESKIDRNCTSGSSGMLWRVGPRDLLNFFRIFIQNRVFPCSMPVVTDLYFPDDFQILHDVSMILELGSHRIIWRSDQYWQLWPCLTAKSPLTTYLLGHSSYVAKIKGNFGHV